MYDATGIRRQAGEHATILNQLVKDFQRLVADAKNWPQKEQQQKKEELKELLGHQPIEVFFGALTGIILAIVVYSFI